jgi:hypothetical protein
MFAPVGRPRLDANKKKSAAVQLRLSAEERVLFDRLLEALRGELGPGVEVSDAGLLRRLLLQEAERRGLLHDKSQAKPKARAKAAKR